MFDKQTDKLFIRWKLDFGCVSHILGDKLVMFFKNINKLNNNLNQLKKRIQELNKIQEA